MDVLGGYRFNVYFDRKDMNGGGESDLACDAISDMAVSKQNFARKYSLESS